MVDFDRLFARRGEVKRRFKESVTRPWFNDDGVHVGWHVLVWYPREPDSKPFEYRFTRDRCSDDLYSFPDLPPDPDINSDDPKGDQ